MNICFRVDSSIEIGSGHVMRCLTLAEEFTRNGHNVVFMSRLHEGNLCNLMRSKGYEVLTLEKPTKDIVGTLKHAKWLGVTTDEDLKESEQVILNSNHKFDWIIIDHYAIDITWERSIRKHIPNVMVIDDIADRQHDCDILLDQNFYQSAESRYLNLVPSHCNMLLGPKYALLRNEFIEYYPIKKEHQDIKKILVFYGGSDATDETLKAINAIKNINDLDLHADVVVGGLNSNKALIKEQCEDENFTFHYNINYMAKLMHEADFAVCAGGSTTWERYCVGLPAIVTAVAYNQVELCENAHILGVDQYIGLSNEVTVKSIEDKLKTLLMEETHKKRLIAKEVVDGNGKKRVLDVIRQFS